MIKKYTLKNEFLTIEILNLGGIIHGIYMPDSEGNVENIIHGYDKIEDYKKNEAFFGALIGRIAGRIKNGSFELNGHQYQIPKRDRGNALHGGLEGFDTKFWNVNALENALELTYRSCDGEEGFPGNVDVTVIYRLEGNSLSIEYDAVSDQDTVFNMTNHSYFNLNPQTDILNTHLYINSDSLIEIDESSLPTGKLMSVDGSPFDFRRLKRIGRDIDSHHKQLDLGCGYDHPWRLNQGSPKLIMHEEESGRMISIESDQEALVLYSYNFPIKKEKERIALAIEFQNDPDGMNQDSLNSCILRKGEHYKQKTVYTFEVVYE